MSWMPRAVHRAAASCGRASIIAASRRRSIRWPNVASQFGILDSCGFPKDNFFYYKAWWGKEPVLHLFPHWNWQGREGQKINVWCHSNLDRVELFVERAKPGRARCRALQACRMGRRLSRRARSRRAATRTAGRFLTATRETTGAPAQILLEADRTAIDADGEDVAVVSAEIADAQGRVVPTADNPVTLPLCRGRAL